VLLLLLFLDQVHQVFLLIQLLIFVTNFSLAWTAADVLVKMCHFWVGLVAADDFFPHNWEGVLKLFRIQARDEIKHARKIICPNCSTCYEYADCYTQTVDPITQVVKLSTKTCTAMTIDRKQCNAPLLVQRKIGKGQIMLVPVKDSSNYTYLGLKNGLAALLSREDIREVPFLCLVAIIFYFRYFYLKLFCLNKASRIFLHNVFMAGVSSSPESFFCVRLVVRHL
jgi:hypothetical protein